MAIKIGVKYMGLKNMVDDHGYVWVDLWKGRRNITTTYSTDWYYNTTADYETENDDV